MTSTPYSFLIIREVVTNLRLLAVLRATATLPYRQSDSHARVQLVSVGLLSPLFPLLWDDGGSVGVRVS